ncbi:MAG: baseplate J/gp47 family protein [Clostridia bacterium]|nr:baseplate J/gp47 family protein [Clostridia bacterium]
MAEFNLPSFLQNRSTEDYMELVSSILPKDIDLSQGGHAWNMTIVSALLASELCEYVLPEVIKTFVPEHSYGTYLDDIARARAMKRRAATAANGTITVTGAAGTVIPAGSLFATSSINDEPSVDYVSVETATIPDSGTVTVNVVCEQTGTIGNTAAATVIHVGSKITGITSVTNEKAITGGTEEEEDESLITRICEYDQALGDSFVGSPADYKRWAESVDGVGTASVIPAKDTSGLVTIVIVDANGDPATETLCEAVYNHIMSPEDELARQAPTGASLSVVAPTIIALAVKADIVLAEGATAESVNSDFLYLLQAYLPEAVGDEEIRYSRITRELSNVKGVYDYSNVQIGVNNGGSISYGTENISISETQMPTVIADNLHLTTS